MIKVVVYLLVAIACGVTAAQNPPSNHPELTNLSKDQVDTFSAFCIQTPSLVRAHLAARPIHLVTNHKDFANHIFDILYHSVDQIGLEPYTFQRDAAEQLARKIRDSNKGSADFELSPLSQLPSEEKYAYLALFGLLEQTKNAASRETLSMLDKYREIFGASNMRERLEQACQIADGLESYLTSEFNSYLKQVGTTSNNGLADVRCATSQKVLHLNSICRFAMHAPKVQSKLTYFPVV